MAGRLLCSLVFQESNMSLIEGLRNCIIKLVFRTKIAINAFHQMDASTAIPPVNQNFERSLPGHRKTPQLWEN